MDDEDRMRMKAMINGLFGTRKEAEYEPIGPLTEEQRKLWEEAEKLYYKARDLHEEAQAKKALTWVEIKKSLRYEDRTRQDLKIEDGVVWGSVDKPKEERDTSKE